MEAKFFAIIDSRKAGPFTLAELESQGVGPDTYVWCKGMQKWRRARHVADVCRYWRQRLAGELPEERKEIAVENRQAQEEIPLSAVTFRQIRGFNPEEGEPNVNIDDRPKNLLMISLAVTILCMPLTGFIAIYFSSRTNALWMRAVNIKQSNPEEAEKLRRESHDSCRSAKMWIGITFFLGLIVQGVIMRFVGQNM